MGRERRNGSYGCGDDFFFADNVNAVDRWSGENGGFTDHSYNHYGHGDSCSSLVKLFPIPSSSSSPSASPLQPQASTSQSGYIQHPVSKFDTLAGIAIRYGVEVADIKRLNGLVTDIQMFALKSVNIPPGRHPPSTCLSNRSDVSGESSSERSRSRHQDLLDSFHSLRLKSCHEKVSPAMDSLRGYYRLRCNHHSQEELPQSEAAEMAMYRNQEDGALLPSYYTNPPLSHHRKSRSVSNSFDDEMDMTERVEAESDRWSVKLMRRKQKSEADFTTTSIEKKNEMKKDNGFVSAEKSLSQRSKQLVGSGPNLVSLGDSVVVGNVGVVRKSTSTPSLQDEEMGSIRYWKRNLKPDLQASSSAAAIPRPILPMSGWKTKTALD